jgi:hypothetical protein
MLNRAIKTAKRLKCSEDPPKDGRKGRSKLAAMVLKLLIRPIVFHLLVIHLPEMVDKFVEFWNPPDAF